MSNGLHRQFNALLYVPNLTVQDSFKASFNCVLQGVYDENLTLAVSCGPLKSRFYAIVVRHPNLSN